MSTHNNGVIFEALSTTYILTHLCQASHESDWQTV